MTDEITVPRADIEDLMQALATYQHMALNGGNIWGQQDARDLMTRVREAQGFGYVYFHLWFGRNHQGFKPGDQARYVERSLRYGPAFSIEDEQRALTPHAIKTTFHPCEILACYTHGALVNTGVNGVEWMAWHTLHRLDRLHSEPTFDVANYAAIVEHMGLDYDPAGFPEPVAPLFLAPAAPTLSVVKGGS